MLTKALAEYCFLPLDLPAAPSIPGISLIDQYQFRASTKDPHRIDAWTWMPLRWTGQRIDHFQALYEFAHDWRWIEYPEPTAALLAPLIRYVETEIPYKKLTYAVLLQGNTNGVPPHLDFLPLPEKVRKQQPANYRILLEGNLFPSFFLSKDVQGSHLIYPQLPSTTNAFVLHAEAFHGAVYRGQKCVLFLSGEVDEAKHEKLLQRSLEKYAEFGIRFQDLSSGKHRYKEEVQRALLESQHEKMIRNCLEPPFMAN